MWNLMRSERIILVRCLRPFFPFGEGLNESVIERYVPVLRQIDSTGTDLPTFVYGALGVAKFSKV